MFRRPGQVTDAEWVRLVAFFFGPEVAAEEMKKLSIQQIVEIRRIVPNTAPEAIDLHWTEEDI